MATNTYVALATQTLSSNATSVTFSSIPQTYTDLVLVMQVRCTRATSQSTLTGYFNADSATTNYSVTELYGNGANAFTSRVNGGTYQGIFASAIAAANNTAGVFSTVILNVQNYTNATTFKTWLSRFGTAEIWTGADVGLWRGTPAAVTSITITEILGNSLVAGSTFNLYGIAAASVGAKATGGIISSDANYFYHTFAASGNFVPTQSLTADVLVVAGGGGACNYTGGGAGGLLGFSGQSLTTISYAVTVGGGGASPHGGANNPAGVNGGDSQFGSLTLVKGGGGGGIAASVGSNGISGASGGGGAPSYGGWGFTAGTQIPQGGTATPAGQGNAGGNGSPYQAGPTGISGGGGGGASAIGGAGTIGTAGAGGTGSSAYSSWGITTGVGQNSNGTYYFAGGGAGYSNGGTQNSGGLGGGGSSGNAGRINTGGGAGGGTSGSGGSGIVIVRYAK